MRSIKDGSIGYSNFLIQHRFIVFLLVLLCTVGLCIPLANMGVEMDNRPERFAPAGDSSFSDLAEMHKEFGRDDYFVLLVKGDVWSPTFLESVEELHKDLMKLEQPPDLIWSLYNAPIFMEVDGRRKLVRIGKDVQKTTELQKGSAHLEGKLVNKDGTWSTIWCQAPVFSEKESAEYFQMLEGMVTERSKEGFSILLGGVPAFSASLDALTMEESSRLGGFAFLFMIVFLAVWFRRVSMVVGPFVVMLLGIIWTYGVMAVMGVSLSYMTSVLPGFLISVCVGDAMHIQALVHREMNLGIGKKEAIQNAFSHAWKPILWTTLTTAGGLLSFRFATLPAVSEMGTFGAIGVAMACVLSLALIPSFLSFARDSDADKSDPNPQESLELRGFLGFCFQMSKSRHAKWIVSIFCFSTVLAGIAMTSLKTEHEPLSWLPQSHSTRMAMDVLDSEFGGAGELTIWVRSTDQQGVLSTRHLQSMYELEKRVLSYQDEEGLVSLSRGIGIFETLRLLHESRDSTQTFDEFMNDDIALTRFVMQMSLARPDWSSDVVSVDQRSAKFVFRLPWQPAQKYVPLRTFLEEERDALVPKGLDAKPLGVLFTLLATFGVLVDELIVSFGVAVVVISLLMMFFLRSIRLGIISLIPNLIPIILTLGCMSFLGIHLDLGTVLFASIVLGICVDDTIHLLHHFRLSYESHGRVDDAIKEALSYAGKAILVTSVLLIFCMGIYLFSDLASLQRFGGLMLVSVVFALISDLLCTPIVLRFVYRDRIEE